MIFVICIIVVALAFEYVNGFHDTANAVATSVATKALTPVQAILLAAFWNLVGALMGTAVAKTVGAGLVNTTLVSPTTVGCALVAGIIWNLLTWYVGLPSSSSHALIGGLCGAALASASGDLSAVIWYDQMSKSPTGEIMQLPWYKAKGMVPKVFIPMFLAPLCGMILAYVFTGALYALLRRPIVLPGLFAFGLVYGLFWILRGVTDWSLLERSSFTFTIAFVFAGLLYWRHAKLSRVSGMTHAHVNTEFRWYQLGSASWMSYAHGLNDAQKTMGIIALLLYTATTQSTAFKNLPPSLEFLRTPTFEVALWVKVTCAITIALGTAAGGWRIIRTLGTQMTKLQPIHGFSAQTTAALVIESASGLGVPLSTTHVISGSIIGVGATRRLNAVKWSVVEKMVWAWLMTIPICAGMAFAFTWIAHQLGF
jgi:inorganic phosphate transporter, PiT family